MRLKAIIIKGNPNKQFSITQTKEFYQTLEKIFPNPIWLEADSNSSRIPLDADCYILFSKGEKQTKWLLEKGIPRLKIIHIGTSDFYENKVGLWLTNTRDKTQMGDLQGDSLKHHWTLCRSMQNKLKNFRDALIKYQELTDKAIAKTISEAEYNIGISEIFMKEVFNENSNQTDFKKFTSKIISKEDFQKTFGRDTYLETLKELHDKSFGTKLTNKDVETWDTDNIYIQIDTKPVAVVRYKIIKKTEPENKKYFVDPKINEILYLSDIYSIQKGSGKKLMEFIHKLGHSVLLRAHTQDLIPYYKKFGYEVVSKSYKLRGNLMIFKNKKKIDILTESDSPLDYPDTNPYNDPETQDDIRRNQENPADSEHNHYNPIDTIETIFRWLTYEKGKDLDPQSFSIKAEIGTTIKMTNIIRYFISKDLILRKIPCMHVPIGEYQYGIANINTLKFFNSEVENTLSGQTHHSTKKLIPFKYSPIITDSGKDYIIEFYDKIDTDFKPIYTEYLSNLNETLYFLT